MEPIPTPPAAINEDLPDATAGGIRLPDTVHRLLTREEAAFALGLSLRAFCRLIASGDIPVVKIGKSLRITQRALGSFIEARESRYNPKRSPSAKKRQPVTAAG